MTWKHWRTGEIWPSEADYIYHVLMQPQVYNEKARKGLQRYYEKLRQ